MNIGFTSNSILHTRHQGHPPSEQRSNIPVVSEREASTRTDAADGTSSAKNDAETNTSPQKQHDEVAATQSEQARSSDKNRLDDDALKEVENLKKRDREVRAHEAAHMAAAGQYAQGGISYTYKKGPDGASYAVGGEVSIDTSPVPNDPQATLRKASRIKAAALAPAEPSSQDKSVAAEAAQLAAQARQQITQEHLETSKQNYANIESRKEKTDSSEKAGSVNQSTKTEATTEENSKNARAVAARTYDVIENLNQNNTQAANLLDQIA